MIAYLTGAVHDIKQQQLVILVNGIGFAVHVPSRYCLQKGQQATLEIYCHMTQDNGLQLYGFETIDERAVFVLIISCSGLGPKIGLAVLGALTPPLFASAVLSHDIKTLSSIEGIGVKKAESMVLQLKDKISKLALTHSDTLSNNAAGHVKQLSDVLVSLGYSRTEISMVLEHLRQAGTFQQGSFDELVRKGLGFLAKK